MDNLWIIHVLNSCDGSAPNGAEIYSNQTKYYNSFNVRFCFNFV